MESPPPYSPPPRKSSSGLIIGLVIGGVLLCCVAPLALLGGGAYFGMKKVGPLVTCAMGFEQIRDSVVSYSEANGGKLPHAKKWMDEVRPYYQKELKKMEGNPFGSIPAEGVWSCTDDDGKKTGIAFNSALDGKNLKDVKDQIATMVIFEMGQPELNKSAPYKEQDKATSPKAFGKPRGWFAAPLSGEVKAGNQDFDFGGNGRAKVRVKSE